MPMSSIPGHQQRIASHVAVQVYHVADIMLHCVSTIDSLNSTALCTRYAGMLVPGLAWLGRKHKIQGHTYIIMQCPIYPVLFWLLLAVHACPHVGCHNRSNGFQINQKSSFSSFMLELGWSRKIARLCV